MNKGMRTLFYIVGEVMGKHSAPEKKPEKQKVTRLYGGAVIVSKK